MTNLNVTLSRRGLFKTIPIAAAVPSAASMFITGAAKAQEAEETGFTICDNCNQMPMCGIKFQKQGNTILSVIGKNISRSSSATRLWQLCRDSITRIAFFIQ